MTAATNIHFPKIEGIPDWVYESTPVPRSCQEAELMLLQLSHDTSDIAIQLRDSVSRIETEFNGDEYTWGVWHARAKNALRTKKSQYALIKGWLQTHNRHEREKERLEKCLEEKALSEATAANSRVSQLGEKVDDLKKENAQLKKQIRTLATQQEAAFRMIMLIFVGNEHSWTKHGLDGAIDIVRILRGLRGKEVDSGFIRDVELLKAKYLEEVS